MTGRAARLTRELTELRAHELLFLVAFCVLMSAALTTGILYATNSAAGETFATIAVLAYMACIVVTHRIVLLAILTVALYFSGHGIVALASAIF
jgi:hypothetical protein